MKRFGYCVLAVLVVLVAPLVTLVVPAAAGEAVGWYVDCSGQLIALLDGGQPGQADAQCKDTINDGYTAPVRKTLEEATAWLTNSHGFPSPHADTIEFDGNKHFVAVVYLTEEALCGDRVACLNLDDRRVYVANDYIHDKKAIVHELFHTIQLAYGARLFEVLGTAAQSQTPDNMSQLSGWITEGTAEAVGHTWASREPASKGQESATLSMRRHDVPLHKPASTEDTYNTAGFWHFVGSELQSPERIRYLVALLREGGLSSGNGLKAVDDFLKTHGGLFKLFPRFLAKQSFGEAFGEIAQWRATLPANKTESSTTFSGNVKAVAGKAARLQVRHSSEKPVDVEIRFLGDHSDLHLLVDKEVQALGPDLLSRNTFAKQLGSRSEVLEIVVAEVAENAEASDDRQFELEVVLKEGLGCFWSASTSGTAAANMGGEAMRTGRIRTGEVVSNTINLHHAPEVDAFTLVPDPDTPLVLILGFPGELRTGVFRIDHAELWGRTFPLSEQGTGNVQLTVDRNAQSGSTSAESASGGFDDTGVTRVTGSFSVEFDRIQSWMRAEESGPISVRGQFAWSPECDNRKQERSQEESSLYRELREGLLHEDIRRSFPTPPAQ